MKNVFTYPVLVLTVFILSGCMSMNRERETYLLEGIDISQTLRIAEYVLQENKTGSSLTMWAIRDQIFTEEQAGTVNNLYYSFVEGLPSDFDTWHFTWAISNIYRQNSPEVQTILLDAYSDAITRAAALQDPADTLAGSKDIYRGDVHFLGRGYAKSHLVVPGNRKYLQSAKEFFDKEKKKK